VQDQAAGSHCGFAVMGSGPLLFPGVGRSMSFPGVFNGKDQSNDCLSRRRKLSGTDRTRLTDLPLAFFFIKTVLSGAPIIRRSKATTFIVFLCSFAFPCLLHAGNAAQTIPSQDTLRIGAIYCNGNHVTKPEVIQFVMAIDSGSVYDSTFIQNTVKQRILNTNFFLKVTILPVIKKNKVDLYVVVKEPLYIGMAGTGYDYIATACPARGLQDDSVSK
jgi:hypothetical protein